MEGERQGRNGDGVMLRVGQVWGRAESAGSGREGGVGSVLGADLACAYAGVISIDNSQTVCVVECFG